MTMRECDCFLTEIPPPSKKLPEYLLVVLDKVLLENPRICERIQEYYGGSEWLEVYSVSSTRVAAFAERFPIVDNYNSTFIFGELYRQHPFEKKRYIWIKEYQRTIDIEIMHEAVVLLADLGAKAVKITSLPSNRYRTSLTSEVAVYKPHVRDTRLYYLSGLQFPCVQDIASHLENEQTNFQSCSVNFSTQQMLETQLQLQAHVDRIVGGGVGVSSTKAFPTLREFDYLLHVEFLDRKAFAKAREWDPLPSKRAVEVACRSLSNLASQRAQHWSERHSYREDLRVLGKDSKPMDEWLRNYDGVNTMPELFRAEGLSNVLYVPLVLYGPSGCINTSVLFTWRVAVQRKIKTLHDIDAWSMWDAMIGAGNWRGQSRKMYGTFMQNVRFDPRASGLTSFTTGNCGVHNNEQYEQMSEKDVAKLLVNDTPDAATIDRDVYGTRFPFGLRILTLDGNMVNQLRKERDAREAGETGDLSDQDYADLEERWSKTSELVGPERPPAPDDVPIVIGLDHYPPIACVLKFDSEPVDDVPKDDERAACVAIVKSELGVTRVWPLRALHAPDTAKEAEKLTRYYEKNAKELKTRVERLDKVAAEAVEVLNKLFLFITEVEFDLRRQAERAKELKSKPML
ncbi:Hypothetical Protein FCC1311_076562 [Hondaea fermentalgiana]|uniref:Uncharacterized protein n=1 Tax=Hondaea fermentalgiana TaxID=2315210 RepID=A0A2R5GKJ7_9STRA|nr:Hypothetical Protein FCC1311_076562 [Hondaea fermentalgiana]|eukprot:GBG31432.1 Hypothetical Protein FCC1311_076562 [Hondaea fermentalgiana]